jgi:predicted dehydrogenase
VRKKNLMNVVVIGTGFGRYAMAPVYTKLGCDVELVSPREPRAIEGALASKVDLVSVHSPPFMHHDHAMKAIERGYAVLCDKPFGLNAVEARAMRDRARQASVLHFLNCEFRFNLARSKMKELIDEGAIGVVEHVSITLLSNALRGRDHAWLNDQELGGGYIGAFGSHVVDLLRWLLDSEIADCGGVSRIESGMLPDGAGGQIASTAEDAFAAWFLMQNGCTASVDTAFSACVPMPRRMTVMGSEAALELVGETKLTLRRAPAEDRSISRVQRLLRAQVDAEGELIMQLPPPADEPHRPMLIPWLAKVKEALSEGRQISPSFDDGVAVAEAVEKLKANVVRAGRVGRTEVQKVDASPARADLAKVEL